MTAQSRSGKFSFVR